MLDTSIEIEVGPEVYNPSDDSYLLLKVVDVSQEERFLEMGPGTGLLSIHAAKLGAIVTAADVNPHAVECTKRNAAKNSVRIDTFKSDLFEKVQGNYDVIVFNPPYLPGATTSTSWIERAWSGGDEGSETAVQFLNDAWKHLSPGGRIFMILSSVGGLMSVLKSARERYDSEMLEEQHMFFESIYAYRFRLKTISTK
ncbi:MAG: HemK2/MTQ2 family protein methyltransferase [Thermoplasmatota archaeon]|nr:methyltransferase [Candidatus Thermoplasmatota archaeon]